MVAGRKMLLDWFDSREAAELGLSLADHFAARGGAESALPGQKARLSEKATQAFLLRVDREARPLQLNAYKRAKLANSFRWRLLDQGVEEGRVDELTRMLLLRLAANGTSPAQPGGFVTAPPPPKRSSAGRVASLVTQALEYGTRGSHAEAIRCYEEILDLDPRHALAHNNLGVALLIVGRYAEAEREFRRAIDIKRNYPDALCNLGIVLRYRGLIPGSETALRRAVKLSPRYVHGRVSLGMTLILAGRLQEAKDCFDKALKMEPRHVDALVGGAQIAEVEGRFAEAEALLERAVEVDPMTPSAWAARPRLRKMTRADAAWLEGAERVAAGPISSMDQTTLRFAIGKYWDDVGDFAQAFRSYQRANELQKLVANPYDRRARTSFVDDLMRVYTREALSPAGLGASDSERPVFVVGMMRSGTSLIEQIISSHPDAKGAGELEFWPEVVHKHEAAIRQELPAELLRKKWAETYLQTLKTYSPDALRVVDKSNFNSDHLGIIHCVFPRARFIYVRRDPIDTCLSCYFQQFVASLNFTMDLSDLAHYYVEHRRVVDHWRAVLPPGTLLDVPYSELVADQEKWTRQILDFLGLPWDARCLQFHEIQRPVLTASTWQVRQKVYKSSVGRWRNYRKFIGPLLPLAKLG
jgi:tetratricopeptide (TPR) repeat protein